MCQSPIRSRTSYPILGSYTNRLQLSVTIVWRSIIIKAGLAIVRISKKMAPREATWDLRTSRHPIHKSFLLFSKWFRAMIFFSRFFADHQRLTFRFFPSSKHVSAFFINFFKYLSFSEVFVEFALYWLFCPWRLFDWNIKFLWIYAVEIAFKKNMRAIYERISEHFPYKL